MFIPGALALWVAFAAVVASSVLYVRSLRGHEGSRVLARQMYALATVSIVVASAILMYLILSHDFRVHYVFAYSDRSLPPAYLFSTFWAGQEGSFLLWLLWGFLVGLPLIRYARHYEDRTLLVYNLTLISLLVILLKQSPFRFLEGLPPGQVPFDGQGLNPLLQNPWMTIHPPIMFLGYAATAVPFAFAVAALWERRYEEWIKASLPWALVSVVTLGAGIVLGGYWAYITLGWGGYWGWDPVENASLVPWLASAALVHGMLLQRARGRFRKLNFSLAILSYTLVVYATFLTRSGVLADFSVHSFVDLGITGWLVGNIFIFLLGGFAFLAWRWREIPTAVGDEPVLSRTWLFTVAIAALVGTATVVLVGTSSPLITRLASQPAQVTPDYYNRVTLPIGIGIALLLGLVPYLHWRGSHANFRSRLAASAAVAVIATGIALAAGARGPVFLLFLFVSFLAFAANLLKTWDEVRSRRFRTAGGYLAHVGLGLMLAGIVTSSAWDRTEKVMLPLGEGREVMGHTLTFRGVDRPSPDARDAMLVEVESPSGRSYMARPRMFRSTKTNQIVAHPDVRARLTHDVYISPIEFDPGKASSEAIVLELHKGETRTVSTLTITFSNFDLTGAHGTGERVAIGALLDVLTPTGSQKLTPVLAAAGEGFEAVPVQVPGTARGVLQLVGVNASTGVIRLHIHGLATSPAVRTSLAIGESVAYQGYTATLATIDAAAGELRASFSVHDPEGGVAAPWVTASVADLDGGGHRHTDGAIPGLANVAIRLEGSDPGSQRAAVAILDPDAGADAEQPMRFAVDVSIKPMINLLWSGLVLVLLGGVIAVARRGEEFSTAVEQNPAPGPDQTHESEPRPNEPPGQTSSPTSAS